MKEIRFGSAANVLFGERIERIERISFILSTAIVISRPT
jgi:hypothetical protein